MAHNFATKGPRWLKFFYQADGSVTSVHAKFRVDRTNGSEVMYRRSLKRKKTVYKSALIFDNSGLAHSIATKLCGNVDDYMRNAHAKFHVDPRSGSKVMAGKLSNFSFSLRKSNEQY